MTMDMIDMSTAHYKNLPMQYTDFFFKFSYVKNENFLAQNIDCGLGKAVLTSTHNLCFGTKIRKIGIPLLTPVFLYTDTNNTSQPTWSILSR